MAPMSAYKACPLLSATIVLTHGMPWYFFSTFNTPAADDAWSTPRKWLKTRKLSALASRIVNAVSAVHGSGMPRMLLNTGPYRVHHVEWVAVCSLPSLPLTVTLTVRCCIFVGVPSTRYDVGSPGTNVSWYGGRRNAVETVWLHAIDALWPMSTTGTPNSEAPVTFTTPGIVSCAWEKRSGSTHGKCGLPSRRPCLWSRVPDLPTATALEPRPPSDWCQPTASSRAARCGSRPATGAGLVGEGGVASAMPGITTSYPASNTSW